MVAPTKCGKHSNARSHFLSIEVSPSHGESDSLRIRYDPLSALGCCAYCFGSRLAFMDFLSAITPQIAVLGLGALVLLVLTFVLVSLALRG